MTRRSDVMAGLLSMMALGSTPTRTAPKRASFDNPPGTKELKRKKKAARKQARRQRKMA